MTKTKNLNHVLMFSIRQNFNSTATHKHKQTYGANSSLSSDINIYISHGAISVSRRFQAERAAACSDANSADTTGTVPFPFRYDPEKTVSNDSIS
jgi:hypothetical protein